MAVEVEALTPLLEAIQRPISEANPVGEDITYDDDFQTLKDEIDQLSSVNPEGVDVEQIVERCQRLLGQKAKDLRVSTYLAMALARTEGFRGILEGLRAQEVLVEGYWEAMHPPLRRMRARGNAFQFMVERLTEEAEEREPGPGDYELLESAIGVVAELQGFTMEAMGEDAPVLSRLKKALEAAQRKAPKPEAAPAPAETQPANAPVATTEVTPDEPAPVAEPPPAEANGAAEGSLVETLKQNPTPLLIDVAQPISEANPVGEDITYDDDFQTLKDEIDQLSSVNPEGVDVEQIVERCQRLLGQKAKDLRVSTYLAMALARTEGFRGILEGLRAQEVLVEGYWEAMHPPLRRMRARGNAFQFMVERLTEEAEEQEPTAADKEAIEGALEVLQSVQAFTMEAMGEDAPVLSRLKKALEEALRRVPKPKPAAPPPKPAAPKATASQPSPAATAQAPAAASHAATSAPAVAAPQSATDALGSVMTLAGFIHEQAPTNPSAYRLARVVRWDDLQGEPNNQQGKTMLEDLAPHRLTYLNNLVEEADWATLLNVAEDTFKELPYHFLLDLQRFVVMAMDGLGTPYQAAKEAVLIETAMLLKRIPGLPRLMFMNGLPFADNATQFWIEQTVEPVLASGEGGGGMSEGDDKVLAEQHDEAKKLFAEGKLREALGVLQAGARQDGSPRSRFRRRFYMALLCMQGNQPVIACPMLEDLDQEIERYSLASWEPDLALEVWTHLHRCYELLKGDENASQDGIDDRARRIFAKICQIDVTRALKTGG